MRICQATTADSILWVQRAPMCVGNVVFIRYVLYELMDGDTHPYESPFDSLKDAIEAFNQLNYDAPMYEYEWTHP